MLKTKQETQTSYRREPHDTPPSNGNIAIQSTDSDNTPVNMGYAKGPVQRAVRTDQLVSTAADDTRDMVPESRMGKMKG